MKLIYVLRNTVSFGSFSIRLTSRKRTKVFRFNSKDHVTWNLTEIVIDNYVIHFGLMLLQPVFTLTCGFVLYSHNLCYYYHYHHRHRCCCCSCGMRNCYLLPVSLLFWRPTPLLACLVDLLHVMPWWTIIWSSLVEWLQDFGLVWILFLIVQVLLKVNFMFAGKKLFLPRGFIL